MTNSMSFDGEEKKTRSQAITTSLGKKEIPFDKGTQDRHMITG